MATKTDIVLGLGYGDEGKGLVTSYLCSQNNPEETVVVRFSGGHQVGHTVVKDGIRHIFSNFGSGTLHGVPTYWSRFCTFAPDAALEEYKDLVSKGVTPKLIISPLCPVTTPFDIAHNRRKEEHLQHGSCGVGFGSTIERHERHFRLYAGDLFYERIAREKLRLIAEYYDPHLYFLEEQTRHQIETFLEKATQFIRMDGIELDQRDNYYCVGRQNLIFEGSQGILLDMDFGFFPHVTRSNTTSKNAMELIKELASSTIIRYPADKHYVTRAYQTRHGNGFMSTEGTDLKLINNENETNKLHDWQGEFRIGIMDLDMINYALRIDDEFGPFCDKHLFITCMDQTEGAIKATCNNGKEEFIVKGFDELESLLDPLFSTVATSSSDDGTKIVYVKK